MGLKTFLGGEELSDSQKAFLRTLVEFRSLHPWLPRAPRQYSKSQGWLEDTTKVIAERPADRTADEHEALLADFEKIKRGWLVSSLHTMSDLVLDLVRMFQAHHSEQLPPVPQLESQVKGWLEDATERLAARPEKRTVEEHEKGLEQLVKLGQDWEGELKSRRSLENDSDFKGLDLPRLAGQPKEG